MIDLHSVQRFNCSRARMRCPIPPLDLLLMQNADFDVSIVDFDAESGQGFSTLVRLDIQVLRTLCTENWEEAEARAAFN